MSGERIAAIVLAAGRSSRMGPHNKLLESVDGKTIIARVAEAAIASGAEPVVLVTGFEAARIEEALRDLTVTLAHNLSFDDGMSTSIRAGLEVLPANSDGALILLGDMPEVEASDIEALMGAFAGQEAICVPMRDGRQGNPVLWGASYFREMMELTGDAGAKSLIVRHAEHVIEVPLASNGIFADVDTPADLARLRASLGAKP
ncbi:MAG TPA: nucleotidyltransferase family protein [Methyloceanibacter sp.]|jgi:molybdenum cofactor cytidylyltransferase|nr:nucleotidyltransferase family protein [Methyloceanibacter sp.]